MTGRALIFAPLLLIALPLCAVTVRQGNLGGDVNEEACSVKRPGTVFKSTDRQIFLAFTAGGVAAGDDLRIDWVDPAGTIQQSVPYTELPSAPALCFTTQLPVSGFPASSIPGAWNVRVVVRDREIWSKGFRIEGDGNADPLRINNVARVPAGANGTELTLDGAGFNSGSIIHVAEYKKEGGWRYIQSLFPEAGGSANRLTVKLGGLGPGEYLAIIRNADGVTSKPARFLVATGGRYRLPFVGGERWLITQGPYGGFSHWHNSLHAYDIAPRSGVWVAAMQGGTAYTHDLGMRQDHRRRTFGNYITIQHDNGEFSHYAHLATGTFLVKNGEHVEAGQPLARVGNSGYTLGEGGGYHVHVHVTKTMPASSPSIPFKFDELSDMAVTKLRGLEVSSNSPPPAAELLKRAVSRTHDITDSGPVLAGSVKVTDTWSEVLTIPQQATSLGVQLAWTGENADLDLHLVSPSGHHYGWYGDTTGYSGQKSTPEQFTIANPEPGTWRVMVAGMSGGPDATAFKVQVSIGGRPVLLRKARAGGRRQVRIRQAGG